MTTRRSTASGNSAEAADRPIDYATAKRLAASRDRRQRRRVGGAISAPPEVLYYLAADADSEVRAAVAGNRATPNQADLLLARDLEEKVRCDLAAKIAGLVPELAGGAQGRAYQAVLAVLEILVRDQLPRVRRIVSETLKDVADAPADVIGRLARDGEIVVAAPVLEHSPVLTDDDLLDIISQAPIPGALVSIARRGVVTEPVADAISVSADEEAIACLLANPSAQIREEALDRLVEQAPDNPSWHPSFVRRPKLPRRLVKKLATFVATHLLDALRTRSDLDQSTAAEVEETVMRRLKDEATADDGVSAGTGLSPVEALAMAARLKAEGTLNEDEVLKAAASDATLARASLAVLTNIHMDLVGHVLESHSARGITALAWKAGLSMVAATRLQIVLGRIPPAKTLRAGRNGVYPLDPEAMRWQLQFLTGLEGL